MTKQTLLCWCLFYLASWKPCILKIVALHSSPTHVNSRLMPYNLDFLPTWGAHFSHETADPWGLGMVEIPGSFFGWKNFGGNINQIRCGSVEGALKKKVGRLEFSCMAQRVCFTDRLLFRFQPILVRCWRDVCSFYIPFSIVMTPPWHILTWCLFGGEEDWDIIQPYPSYFFKHEGWMMFYDSKVCWWWISCIGLDVFHAQKGSGWFECWVRIEGCINMWLC